MYVAIVVTCILVPIQGLSTHHGQHREPQDHKVYYPEISYDCQTVIHIHDHHHDIAMSCLTYEQWRQKAVKMCGVRNKLMYDFSVLGLCGEPHTSVTQATYLYAGVNVNCCFQGMGDVKLLQYLLKAPYRLQRQ